MSIARWNLKEAVAKHWPDEQEADMRQGTWTNGHENAKSETCTETCQVDRPGINVKVVRITRGGLHPAADAEGIARQKAKAKEHAAGLIARIREIQG